MKMYTLCAAVIGVLTAGGAYAADAWKVETRAIVAEGSASKDLHETWDIANDARVEISNVRGTVTITTWIRKSLISAARWATIQNSIFPATPGTWC